MRIVIEFENEWWQEFVRTEDGLEVLFSPWKLNNYGQMVDARVVRQKAVDTQPGGYHTLWRRHYEPEQLWHCKAFGGGRIVIPSADDTDEQ